MERGEEGQEGEEESGSRQLCGDEPSVAWAPQHTQTASLSGGPKPAQTHTPLSPLRGSALTCEQKTASVGDGRCCCCATPLAARWGAMFPSGEKAATRQLTAQTSCTCGQVQERRLPGRRTHTGGGGQQWRRPGWEASASASGFRNRRFLDIHPPPYTAAARREQQRPRASRALPYRPNTGRAGLLAAARAEARSPRRAACGGRR